MSVELLQRLAEEHYIRVSQLIRKYVFDLVKSQEGQPVNVLEVGPGARSIVVRAIDFFSKRPPHYFADDLHSKKGIISILFIDKDDLREIAGSRCVFRFTGENREQTTAAVPRVSSSFVLEGQFINQEFNDYLGSSSREQGKFDLIVMHGALHELYLASTEKAADHYLTDLFEGLHGLLKKKGIVFLGDPYYPPYYTSSDSYEIVQYLVDRTQHGNAPVAFTHPEYLLSLLVKRREPRFDLLHDEEMYYRIEDLGLNKGRKFYIIALQKVE